MKALRTSETSVHFNVTTWRYNPEDPKLHTRRHENLKSHIMIMNWKGHKRKRPWPNLRYYTGICLKELSKIVKTSVRLANM
jgi:hypothetical protein